MAHCGNYITLRETWYLCDNVKLILLVVIISLDESLDTWPIVKFLTLAHSLFSWLSFYWQQLFANHDSLTVRITVFKMSIVLYLYDYFIILVSHNYVFTFHQNSITLFSTHISESNRYMSWNKDYTILGKTKKVIKRHQKNKIII